jgi:hypothetical protein
MVANTRIDSETDHRDKPDGGYVHVSTFRFGIAWWAYLQGKISIRAVRVLLALHELIIRRSAHIWSEKKQGNRVQDFTPHYSTLELAKLCGLPEKKARVALNELLNLGLVTEFSSERILFAQSFADLDLGDSESSSFWEWFSALTKRKRVPIPRRILALACESSSPAQIAFILGASLRCIYLHPKEGGFSYLGWLSSAWLSKHFGICLRAIKGAKSHLVALGWVNSEGRATRFGEFIAINPAWERITATREAKSERINPQDTEAGEKASAFESPSIPINLASKEIAASSDIPSERFNPQDHFAERESVSFHGPNSAPPSPNFGPNSAPPSRRESFSETEIQRPRESPEPEAKNSGPGIFQNSGELKTQEQAPKYSPPVRLSSIKPEDFQDVGRALELFRQAVKCGFVSDDSEHSRLRWMAAIERARTVPAKNPAGVFLHIIKNRKWDYLSDGHWFAAHERL